MLLTISFGQVCFALEPGQILVIANSDIPASERIAQYYCQKRDVPADNFITFQLGKKPVTSISRNDYDNKIAQPLREILKSQKFAGKIKCLLTIYGVPITVQGRGQLEGQEQQLKQLNELIAQASSAYGSGKEEGLLLRAYFMRLLLTVHTDYAYIYA